MEKKQLEEKFTIEDVTEIIKCASKEKPREEMLYTIKEAAAILKTSINKMYEYQHAGIIKFLKLGTAKVTKKELERFLEKYEGMDVTDPYNVTSFGPESNGKVG